MDLTKVFCTMEPCSVGGARAVEKNMNVVLDIENGTRLDGVLLLVIRLREFVFNVEFSVDGVDFGALFFFGVVTS